MAFTLFSAPLGAVMNDGNCKICPNEAHFGGGTKWTLDVDKEIEGAGILTISFAVFDWTKRIENNCLSEKKTHF